MTNFDYRTPTRLIFGQGVVAEKLASVMAQFGKRVLLTYGGGSIKRSGLYDQVKEILKDKEIIELADIQPNPKYDPSVLEGVRLCKENHIDVILSVGGGSVLDCSKAIAAGACYDGDPWDLISYKVKAQAALPIVDIITMAATGSEYDAGGVISRTDINDKRGYIDSLLYPVASFIDPTYTYTVPVRQTIAGVADAINHIFEQYFSTPANDLSDGFCESGLRTLMKHVRVVLKDPENYESRANIFLACTYGCNRIYSLGIAPGGWPMHAMEHTLSAYYDITHGIGLAILTPRWMRHILEKSQKTAALKDKRPDVLSRFVKLGVNVLGIDPSLPEMEIAEKSIQAMYDFFVEIGIPMTLHEVGIDESRLAEMAHHVNEYDNLENAWVPLTEQDILAIYQACL